MSVFTYICVEAFASFDCFSSFLDVGVIMRISNLVSEVLAGRWRWSSDETNLLPRVIWQPRNVASFRAALHKHWRAGGRI